ncbi:ATP-dependent RNA helicase DHX29-like [Physella acuta]|uniref:ATP-dependent RNA helicase DHX29-like n=1 Tax=Physella acuta TaxID=109671 RepID=UPI0027DCC9BF|nr:ATP-dependent RNA helicase DHX29-like [Physella acuta]
MGKRKVPKNVSQPGAESVPSKKDDGSTKETIKIKGKKTYSLQVSTKDVGSTTDLQKVNIPEKLEHALCELIIEEQKSRKVLGDISKRITPKKLTDVYNSLSDAGFSKNQVEAAMLATIMLGGDLVHALDWLCLNTQNDQLPTGFSETLKKEEEKLRPKFDRSLLAQPIVVQSENKKTSVEASDKKPAMKDWILQYAEQSSSDGSATEEEAEPVYDPTSRYAELHSKMQDLKDQAAIAKCNNNTEQHKQLSKLLKEVHLEMSSVEKHPEFDKSIKSRLKSNVSSQPKEKKPAPSPVESKQSVTEKEEGEDLGLGLFAQAEASTDPSATADTKPKEDVRTFEYTRSQWTGKSPKQFLIDWVRKHLQKSGPPKFSKIQVKFNRFKSTVTVDRQKDGLLTVTPDILCDNIKDSEHLAATLALYKLCRGQPVHQLLPPPYRNVWLEWSDEEKKSLEEAKQTENKPRDQFISKLMKKLNIEDTAGKPASKESKDKSRGDEEEEDDWEALADKGLLNEIFTSTSVEPKSEISKLQKQAGSHLLSALQKRRSTSEYQDLLAVRQHLPVYLYRQQILAAVREHSVVVIAGETGSGKSTQVPQFLLEDGIDGGADNINIVCTEPRRISATSLATRVSQEMGESGLPLKEALVGYQIRFESRRGPHTRLMYCTTGVILRQLHNADKFRGVTHLIIDEVHERSVDSDFLMIVVKEILARRTDLKVILMSATLDSQKCSAYFGHCPVINIPGRTFPVQVFYLEDVIEKTGYVVDDDSPYTLSHHQLIKEDTASVEVTLKGGNTSKQNLSWTQEDISKIDRTDLSAETYSLRTRNAITRLNPNRINLDLIVDLLKHLESSPPFCDISGAVLIFLPGLADIQELYEMLTTMRDFTNTSKYQIFALHSILNSQDQSKVFSVPPPGIRKVVIATNIAETGITIPDVVYVIDSGKAKELRYMETSQMSALEEVFISKANCKQRTGRAGRVKEGFCFRLYTHSLFQGLKAYSTPELLRAPLEELCLNIMKCQYGKPHEFLNGALDPPSQTAVSRAMALLREVGACETDESSLTPLGHLLAALPVHVRIGKMLLLGAIFGCLEEIAVIAAAMTDKSPFVVPLSKRSEADVAKENLAVGNSDHLTVYKAYHGWCKARLESRSAENAYLSKHFLKKSTLLEIENVKKDLVKLVVSIGFDPQPSVTRKLNEAAPSNLTGEVLNIATVQSTGSDLDVGTIALVKAVITAGLYPQVGQVLTAPSVEASEKLSCLVETSQGVAQVHPSSVNKHLTATGSWMLYHEKVRMSRVYLKDTTVVSPYALLLFGGAIEVQHTQRVVLLDGWIKYTAVAKTGVIFKELRVLLNSILEKKLREPAMNLSGCPFIILLKDLIRSERPR